MTESKSRLRVAFLYFGQGCNCYAVFYTISGYPAVKKMQFSPSLQPLSLASQAILVATRAMLVPEGEGWGNCSIVKKP